MKTPSRLTDVAQERFVGVTAEQELTPSDQFDAVIAEFRNGIDYKKYLPLIRIIRRKARNVRFISILYKTQDPSGKEVVASGILAYPKTGKIRGTIEVSPVSKELYRAGSVQCFAMEALPSMCGYVVLVPDTIGYGSTQDEVIPILMSENVARVAVDFRQAVQEYMASWDTPVELPAKTICYGYSLGAAGTLCTACYYCAHPELGVNVHSLFLGGGAYDPWLTLNSAIKDGECGYLIYPMIARGLKRWFLPDLNINNLFQGRVLEDFDFIADGKSNFTDLAGEYGIDLHTYLHPDFYSPEKNADINKLMECLKGLKVSVPKGALPQDLKIFLRHSAEDNYVQVESSDRLYQELRQNGYTNIHYRRKKRGSHYEDAARALIELFTVVFWHYRTGTSRSTATAFSGSKNSKES